MLTRFTPGMQLEAWNSLVNSRICRGSRAGSVATLKSLQKSGRGGICTAILGSHLEQLVNELNLAPNVVPPQPPNLPLPDHVHCLIALNRSPGRVELSEALLGVDPGA